MKNLIDQYHKKILKYDIKIQAITEDIRAMRTGGRKNGCFINVEEAAIERTKVDALRQQLFQVTKDLEALNLIP